MRLAGGAIQSILTDRIRPPATARYRSCDRHGGYGTANGEGRHRQVEPQFTRRALGRRFLSRGLPVPSHWLQLGRLLRVAVKLQNSRDSIFSVAYEFGYPDGFAVSNQMERIIGVRPHEVREQLGWEWIMECWLRSEAES